MPAPTIASSSNFGVNQRRNKQTSFSALVWLLFALINKVQRRLVWQRSLGSFKWVRLLLVVGRYGRFLSEHFCLTLVGWLHNATFQWFAVRFQILKILHRFISFLYTVYCFHGALNRRHCKAAKSDAMSYNTIQYNSIRYNTVQCNVIQYSRTITYIMRL